MRRHSKTRVRYTGLLIQCTFPWRLAGSSSMWRSSELSISNNIPVIFPARSACWRWVRIIIGWSWGGNNCTNVKFQMKTVKQGPRWHPLSTAIDHQALIQDELVWLYIEVSNLDKWEEPLAKHLLLLLHRSCCQHCSCKGLLERICKKSTKISIYETSDILSVGHQLKSHLSRHNDTALLSARLHNSSWCLSSLSWHRVPSLLNKQGFIQ